jgi:hypothetical protein
MAGLAGAGRAVLKGLAVITEGKAGSLDELHHGFAAR